ncbi:MAG: CYCXC family (seleno)protein [bacterium]
MKNRILFILIGALAIGAGWLIFMRTRENSSKRAELARVSLEPPVSPSEPRHNDSPIARVPAYQSASQIDKLEPTLPPAQFVGKARAAYQAAKEIPRTLAQLPCYCECDLAFGHKSLQSCFVDDHASQCAVCVDEALLAYKLQKEDKLTPDQVRAVIIEKYSPPNLK